MHDSAVSSPSQRTVMSVNGESKPAIHLTVPTEIHRGGSRRSVFANKRDKELSSTRKLAIADSIDDIIYGPPPPARSPVRPLHKSADPAKLDGSARSLVSEVTLDASTRADNHESSARSTTRSVDASANAKTMKDTSISPKQKVKKTKKKSDASADDGSVLTLDSDELSTISEKKRTKKNSSSRSISSKSSKKSTTKKKKKSSSTKPSRHASTKSVGSCASIDELTVTSGEMSFDDLTINSVDENDTVDDALAISARSARTVDETGKSAKKKKVKAPRRGSTGGVSATKKKTTKKKTKGTKEPKDSSGQSVPFVVGADWGDASDAEDTTEKEPSLMASTLSDGGGAADANATPPPESAVLSQGLQALGEYYE